MSEGKGKEDLKEAISQFFSYMKKHHLLSKLSEILVMYRQYWMKAQSRTKLSFTFYNEQKSNDLEKYVAIIKKNLKLDEPEIVQKSDMTLLGGCTVEVDDTLIDGSIRGQLNTLRKELTLGHR
jgi:F-type H+-transporting ATPase subunit delta